MIGDGTGNGNPKVQDLQLVEIPTSVPITISINGTLDLNNHSDNIGTNLTMVGGTITTGGGTLSLLPNCTITFGGNSSIYGALNDGNGTLTFSAYGLLFMYANVSGSANIVQNDNGSIEWLGANTYAGNYTVNNGALYLENSLALGNITNQMTVNSNTVIYIANNNINLTNQSVTFNNSGGSNYVGNWSVSSWHSSFTNNTGMVIQLDAGCALNLVGTITGPGGLTETGQGTLTLSGTGANNYAGLTTVNGGELDLNKTPEVSAIPPFGPGMVIGNGVDAATVRYLNYRQIYSIVTPVTVNSGGILNLNGYADEVAPLTMDGGQVTTGAGQITLCNTVVVGAGASSISGNVLLDGSIVITNAEPYVLNMLASVSGAAGIIKTGFGELYLSASNSYTGLTVVQQGWLHAQNPWALGSTSSGTVVSNTASLVLEGGIGITNETLTLNGPGVESGWGALDVESDVNTWAGPIINNANSTLDAFDPGSELHINGPISGPGGLELFGNSSGGGTHFFEGAAANTYAGLTAIDAGATLQLSKTITYATVPGNVVVSGTLRLANNEQIASGADVLVNSGALFDFGAYRQDVNTLHGTGRVTFGTQGFLNIGANGGTSTFDGTMSGVGYVNGYTVGKYGAGAFTLTGTNTYLNGSHVFAGTLIVNGSQLQGPVSVDIGAALGGSGIVGSITANGTIAPGNGGPGILSCSNLTFSASGKLVVDLTGPAPGTGYDQLNPLILIGANTLANATLQVVPAFASPVIFGQQFTIVSNATPNLFSGTFNGLPEGSLIAAGGYTFRISYVGGTGNDVVLTLVGGMPGDTVTMNAVASGWYDSTGFHTAANANYFVGKEAGTANLYRNFFVFNAPVSTNAVVHAELFVSDYQNVSPHGQETYLVRGVATPVATLEAGGSGLTGIYNDLGTGAVYAVRSIATNESGEQAIIPLNAKFINDTMAASGGQLALGGSIVALEATTNDDQYLFGLSRGALGDVQLRLTYGTNLLITSANRGWYEDTGEHDANLSNYAVGLNGPNFYRNFFVFNLPAISSQLVDAQLLLNSYTNLSPSGVETYQLYDVTNSVSALVSAQVNATNIYADLGSGTVYGGRDVFSSESGELSTFPLNGNFLAAAQANGGGSLALGGAMTSPNPVNGEMLFAFSGPDGPTDAQLWLGFVTRPVSHPVFAGATPTYLGGGEYQFTLSGVAGSSYEIQASFDLQRWDYVTDVKLTGSTGTFIYNGNTTVPYRFFRAEPLQ